MRTEKNELKNINIIGNKMLLIWLKKRLKLHMKKNEY